MCDAVFLRRAEAGNYLKQTYGFGSAASLAKLATVGGGPQFRKCGSIVLYEPAKLDAWALTKISEPKRSTSDGAHASA